MLGRRRAGNSSDNRNQTNLEAKAISASKYWLQNLLVLESNHEKALALPRSPSAANHVDRSRFKRDVTADPPKETSSHNHLAPLMTRLTGQN